MLAQLEGLGEQQAMILDGWERKTDVSLAG
jgi:hypothetical protein